MSLFISIPLASRAQKQTSRIIELNTWKFRTGDNLAWAQPGFKDAAWKFLEAGIRWEYQGYKKYDGYAWYRVKFYLPASMKDKAFFRDSLQITLGKIDDHDQTFLNGKLLGQNAKLISPDNTGTVEELSETPMAWDDIRNYTVSVKDPRLKWNQENTLAIRVYDQIHGGGLYTLPVSISMKDLKDFMVFDIDSRTLEPEAGGILSKTITLKKLPVLARLKGKVTIAFTGSGKKQVAAQTWDTDLKNENTAFTLRFKGDKLEPMTATYTFTESKTNYRVVYTRKPDCNGGWVKYEDSPILGGRLGTIFDVCVFTENADLLRMYCSWRDKKSIAISDSKDGLHWSVPVVCLPFDSKSGWEDEVNRPSVLKKDGVYHMWYSGLTGAYQVEGHAWIGYATSNDGKTWTKNAAPVLSPDTPWENTQVMCPHVLWDEHEQIFKMWYSAGEQEPEAIGYATSKDGLHWVKNKNNPIITGDKKYKWEQDRVSACQVIKRKDDYLMFYIGFMNEAYAQIGMARSKDGITNWERYKKNPVIQHGKDWDSEAVYKPYAVPDPANNRWLLYYNGRNVNDHEQMGMAIHKGLDLGF